MLVLDRRNTVLSPPSSITANLHHAQRSSAVRCYAVTHEPSYSRRMSENTLGETNNFRCNSIVERIQVACVILGTVSETPAQSLRQCLNCFPKYKYYCTLLAGSSILIESLSKGTYPCWKPPQVSNTQSWSGQVVECERTGKDVSYRYRHQDIVKLNIHS